MNPGKRRSGHDDRGADVDATHDPSLRSWIGSANSPDHSFPVQNLPYGVFKRSSVAEAPRVGVAVGDVIVDVSALSTSGLIDDGASTAAAACRNPVLNPLMSLGLAPRRALRANLSRLLGDSAPAPVRDAVARCLVDASSAELSMPVLVRDYTDFYASIDHAMRVGRLFRPDRPLLPNYRHAPIGYHGRASTIVPSGSGVRRPWGQILRWGGAHPTGAAAVDAAPGGADPGDVPLAPGFAPSRELDYELEVGYYIGTGNPDGARLGVDAAERALFGVCLVNDWSARDIQRWEYQPLGPFLGKSFATSVSPWVVTMEALAPYRVPARARGADEPAPLPYLDSIADRAAGGIAMVVEVRIRTAAMREVGHRGHVMGRTRLDGMYWTPAQLVAHHTSNGCRLSPGDLLASGTVSGPQSDSCGCLLEATAGGAEPVELPTGERRGYLEDGDEVVLAAYCQAGGKAPRIGLGECVGVVLPARPE